MKSLAITIAVLFMLNYSTMAQPVADWSKGGKYGGISPEDHSVITRYATTRVEFFNAIANIQKTALQKLSNELFIKEDLPAGIDYGEIFASVGIKTFAGIIDNIIKESTEKYPVPVVGIIANLGIDIYKKRAEEIARVRQIKSKNSLVDAISELATAIDFSTAQNFSILIEDKVADEYLKINTSPDDDNFLLFLEQQSKDFTQSVPSSDKIYIGTIESLLNYLNSKNPSYAINIRIDYRNIGRIEDILQSDFQRAPQNVVLRFVSDAPYTTRLMNIINEAIDKGSYLSSVLKLKVNKVVTCHFKTKAGDCSIVPLVIRPDNSIFYYFNAGNPLLKYEPYYYDDFYARVATIANLEDYKVRYDDVNNGGSPRVTTYNILFTGAYSNVMINSSSYKKFNP